MPMGNKPSAFDHPFDTPVTSGLRFLVEIFAWVSGPWAAVQLSIWLAVPALVVLVGLPSVFSTRGDKKQVIVPTPGPLRLLLELGLHGVAVAGSWIVWPTWVAAVATLVVIAALLVGFPRSKWLLRGAPAEPSST